MCYMPNLRSRTCRFGPIITERKLVRKCVFCNRRRPHNVSYLNENAHPSCPALNTPGHLIIEPDQPLKPAFEYNGLLIAKDHKGRVAQVWIPPDDPRRKGTSA